MQRLQLLYCLLKFAVVLCHRLILLPSGVHFPLYDLLVFFKTAVHLLNNLVPQLA